MNRRGGPGRTPKWTDEQVADAATWIHNGLPVAEAAQELNVAPSTLYRARRRLAAKRAAQ